MEGESERQVGVCEDYRGIGGEVRAANMCRERTWKVERQTTALKERKACTLSIRIAETISKRFRARHLDNTFLS